MLPRASTATAQMKIDVHCHLIEELFYDALKSLPGVTVKVNPDRFSYLLKDGQTWLPFRPEMFDPDHLIREMDRKGIDVSVLSMNTPSVYIFEAKLRIDLARRLNDAMMARARRNPDRIRGFATLPLPGLAEDSDPESRAAPVLTDLEFVPPSEMSGLASRLENWCRYVVLTLRRE